jgi:hypothetical protein
MGNSVSANTIPTPTDIIHQIEDGDDDLDQIRYLHRVAQQINREDCDSSLTVRSLHPHSLDGDHQRQNACIIRHALSSFSVTSEGIPVGDPDIQTILTPMIPLTTSKDSSFGIVAIAGLRGTEVSASLNHTLTPHPECFAIVKYSYEKDPVPFLYELVMGMFVNRLRRKGVPNFMYTYSGLYCSPPVNTSRAYKNVIKPFEEKFESQLAHLFHRFHRVYQVNKKSIRFGRLRAAAMRFIRREGVYEHNATDRQLLLDFSYILYAAGPPGELEDERMFYKYLSKEVKKALQHSTAFSRLLFSTLHQYQSEYEHLIKTKVSDFNPHLLCDLTRPSSVLIIAERVPDSINFLKWVERDQVSGPPDEEEDTRMLDVWIQLVCALNIAWH